MLVAGKYTRVCTYLVSITEWAQQWVCKASQHQKSHCHMPNYYHIYSTTLLHLHNEIDEPRTLTVKPKENCSGIRIRRCSVRTTYWNALKHYVLCYWAIYVLWPSSTSVMSRTLSIPLALHTVTSWFYHAQGRRDTLFKADLASALYAAVIRKFSRLYFY